MLADEIKIRLRGAIRVSAPRPPIDNPAERFVRDDYLSATKERIFRDWVESAGQVSFMAQAHCQMEMSRVRDILEER